MFFLELANKDAKNLNRMAEVPQNAVRELIGEWKGPRILKEEFRAARHEEGEKCEAYSL